MSTVCEKVINNIPLTNYEINNYYSDILEQNRIMYFNKSYDVRTLIKIIEEKLKNIKEPYVVSLSGGVDSMVLIYILKVILSKKVIAIHINYNNRNESLKEEEYLEYYCNLINVNIFTKKLDFTRNETDRRDYEIKAKQERFDFYNYILKFYNIEYVLLAHHKDDTVENIFNNLMNTRNLMDLAVIKNENEIMGVKILRPMTNLYKDEVYHFANYYSIPYFNDTTPKWSMRGKFRNIVLPNILSVYPNAKTSLNNIANEYSEWAYCIETLIIKPVMDTLEIEYTQENTFNSLKIKYTDFVKCPNSILHEIFKRIFHKIKENSPSKKSVVNLLEVIKYQENNSKLDKSNSTRRVILLKIYYVLIDTDNKMLEIKKVLYP